VRAVLLRACIQVTGSGAELVWVDAHGLPADLQQRLLA
jgi:hypothetical protein